MEMTKVSRYEVRLIKQGADPRPGSGSRIVCFYFLRKNRKLCSVQTCVCESYHDDVMRWTLNPMERAFLF